MNLSSRGKKQYFTNSLHSRKYLFLPLASPCIRHYGKQQNKVAAQKPTDNNSFLTRKRQVSSLEKVKNTLQTPSTG